MLGGRETGLCDLRFQRPINLAKVLWGPTGDGLQGIRSEEQILARKDKRDVK